MFFFENQNIKIMKKIILLFLFTSFFSLFVKAQNSEVENQIINQIEELEELKQSEAYQTKVAQLSLGLAIEYANACLIYIEDNKNIKNNGKKMAKNYDLLYEEYEKLAKEYQTLIQDYNNLVEKYNKLLESKN